VVTLLADLERSAPSHRKGSGKGTSSRPAEDGGDGTDYRGRLWVTRPHPGVDRMASAWLIRRFIDAEARFGFIADVTTAGDAIPFDMFGGGFGHEHDGCTFETLLRRFGIADAGVSRIAELVHDLDLKDGKFGAPEATTVGLAIDGLRLSFADDGALLSQGMTLFEALYRSFAQASPAPRPRSVVTRRKT